MCEHPMPCMRPATHSARDYNLVQPLVHFALEGLNKFERCESCKAETMLAGHVIAAFGPNANVAATQTWTFNSFSVRCTPAAIRLIESPGRFLRAGWLYGRSYPNTHSTQRCTPDQSREHLTDMPAKFTTEPVHCADVDLIFT